MEDNDLFRRYFVEGDITEKMSKLAEAEKGIKKIYPLDDFNTIVSIYNDKIFNIAIYKENNFNILEISKYQSKNSKTIDERVSELETLLDIKLEK